MRIECYRTFIETDELNSKGNKKLMCVNIRRLFFDGDFVGPKEYKVTATRRKGEWRFGVSYMPIPQKPKWPVLKLRPDPTVTWKRERTYDMTEIKDWFKRMGFDGEMLVLALLTAVPENQAA